MVMLGVITDKRGFNGEMSVSNLIAERIEVPADIDVSVGYSERFSHKYKLVYWKSGKRSAKLRLEGITSDERTKALMEMGVFVEEDMLKKSNPETTFSHEIVGLMAIDNSTKNEIGLVADLIMLPANDVIVIDTGLTILSLPFVEEFIADIDLNAGKLFLNLPDGVEELEEPKTGAGNDSID
ncbi:MAG: 16S rRNA processing protein RimM [Candidatus Kapabacteria bacterium]|nr:16S rRNA processing protein RimM [Candidatus Kapabacteria bacterium]